MKLKSKLLIFDFDGTIADTKALYYKAIYGVVRKFGHSYKDMDKKAGRGRMAFAPGVVGTFEKENQIIEEHKAAVNKRGEKNDGTIEKDKTRI